MRTPFEKDKQSCKSQAWRDIFHIAALAQLKRAESTKLQASRLEKRVE
jgi:hypothetical protein